MGRPFCYNRPIVYEQLKSRLAGVLARSRPLKPQTERQLAGYLAEHSTSMGTFLACAPDVLEDYELDIAFGPLFTPTLDERAEVADLLLDGKPTEEQLKQLVGELCAEVQHVTVRLPDGTEAKLRLHEVMIERFVRLLRLEFGPDAQTAQALRQTVPNELFPIAMALLCERGMTQKHQAWFVTFAQHVARRRALSRQVLETIAEFIASQPDLAPDTLMASSDGLLRATQNSLAHAISGHAYWSPDVAQHHQYRGQGNVDKERLGQRQGELERMVALMEDLRTFDEEESK
jgi:hypothetical protein